MILGAITTKDPTSAPEILAFLTLFPIPLDLPSLYPEEAQEHPEGVNFFELM